MSDRDTRKPLIPPPQVRAQTAPPVEPESWEDQSSGGRASTGVTTLPTTGLTATETLLVRSARATNAAESSESKIDLLEKRIDTTVAKVDVVIAVVAELKHDVKASFASNDAKNEQIIGILVDQNKTMLAATLARQEHSGMLRGLETETKTRVFEAQQLGAAEVAKFRELADAEVDKTGKVASITVRKKAWLTALALIGAFATAVAGSGALIHSCGG